MGQYDIIKMGNSESEFEEQFGQLYRFVGVVEDPCFKTAKIYRKIKFNFDYMMVVQRPASEFASSETVIPHSQYVLNRLHLIRKYQNAYTVRLSYSMLIESKGIRCDATLVRLYLQYFNHSLSDYLNALRANKFILTTEELLFVVSSLVEGMLVLRKMEINDFWLTLNNVWVSVDQGNVVVNPAYLIYQAALINNRSQQIHRINHQFKSVDLAASRSHSNFPQLSSRTPLEPLEHTQIQNILELYVQMTRFLSPQQIPSANRLFARLRECRTVGQLKEYLWTECQELNVQQFGEVKEPQCLYARYIE